MRHSLYLLSIILFCGPCLLIIWKRKGRVLKKYELLILILIVLSPLMTVPDYVATRWHTWEYNPATTLNIHFPGEIETYLFTAAVMVILASVTLVWTRNIDLRARKSKRKPRTRR